MPGRIEKFVTQPASRTATHHLTHDMPRRLPYTGHARTIRESRRQIMTADSFFSVV
ncbi:MULTISPECIES: hypothetical protein [Acetobacter]|uniref:Transposase n=1 Tax=Acetobacter thailandicus TaxID=1502842 RepID=A0ABT3QEX1_9PROT|nr:MULTISPECIES: hypothetical protein [Acetobacter]MBS0985687.1 hypothetical protein [Acetobacter thailandicus]MBS1002424.1 hypothetical protein [Acetobacter thailandicus]MCX2563837.1 hypothetical protein [Acetobacter thailandicus]NHN95089.1 hypothetical protein [Acetobacter thailandicus]